MICYLSEIGKIDDQAAASFIRATVDEAVYSRAIGRNLNTRKNDESSICRAVDPAVYFARAEELDSEAAFERFIKSGRVALFHTHVVMPVASLLFRALPSLRVVHVTRHPIDLAEDWYRRGWDGCRSV